MNNAQKSRAARDGWMSPGDATVGPGQADVLACTCDAKSKMSDGPRVVDVLVLQGCKLSVLWHEWSAQRQPNHTYKLPRVARRPPAGPATAHDSRRLPAQAAQKVFELHVALRHADVATREVRALGVVVRLGHAQRLRGDGAAPQPSRSAQKGCRAGGPVRHTRV